MNDHFTNPAPAGRPPTLYHAPALARELIKIVDGDGRLASPALKALAALELDERQLSALAEKANPTPILLQTSANRDTASDEKRRDVYLDSLRVLTAHGERAKPLAGKIAEVLKQEQAPGLKDAHESFRPKVEAEWWAYQADAAQTLLAIRGDIDPHLERVVALWVKLNSPAYIRQSKPHERLINPCALGAASPDKLAPVFAQHIEREQNASPSTSTFLLVEALTGLACTGTRKPEHLSLVASVFNSHVDPNEPITLGGEKFQNPRLVFWQATRPESVRGAAAAALIRLGAAGHPDMPSIKEALEGINRSGYWSIDESSLPGPQWLADMPTDFRKGLAAAASEQLAASDERLRVVGARVLTNLWLAGEGEDESAARLLEAARANADVESLRALLLIAHTSRMTQARKSQVKELFKSLLEQNEEARRTNAVVALGSLYVKDESPRIRSGVTTYVPAPMDEEFAKEFAPALAAVYKSLAQQQALTERRAEVLRALGYARAREQVLNIIASEDLGDSRLWAEALDAAARSGPLQLQGVCQLLDMSAKNDSAEAPARAAAYYVSDGDDTARLLISTLWKPTTAGARNQSADEVEERLRAIYEALNQCKVSPELRDALGPKLVELAKAPGGERDGSLLFALAAKYQETPFAGEITKAAGIEGTWTGTWYHVRHNLWWYVIGTLLLFGAIYAVWRAFVKKPLRRLGLYEKVPEGTIPLPWSEQKLSLRPAARLVLRPFQRRVLDAWVESHVVAARQKYVSYCQRADPWPRPVKVNDERLRTLEPRNLQHVFSGNQAITLVMGGNAQARSKLAYLLGRWAMAERPGERLCKHLMLPVVIKGSPELLEQKDGDLFLQEVTVELRSLIMVEDTIPEELLRHLLKKRRVLVIVDDFPGQRAKGIRRFVRRMSQYPVNASVIISPKGDDLAHLSTATIHIES